jgi:hypothetical protein
MINMEWYKKISNNCQKATFLIEKKKLSGIKLLQQVELRIHLAGCSVCRLYEKQSFIIDHLLKQTRSDNVPQDTRLNEEFKKDLDEKIAQQLKKE